MVELGRSHPCPREVEEVCLSLGGLNHYGKANWRVVWGADRLDWICGKWTDHDDNGTLIREVVENRLVPKYANAIERWILERWMPPEIYGTREDWETRTLEIEGTENVQALGPYPAEGDYEHVHTFEDFDGGFLQITQSMVREVLSLLLYSLRTYTNRQRKLALERRTEKEERDYDSYADDVLSDTDAFHGQPFITVPAVPGNWTQKGKLIIPA